MLVPRKNINKSANHNIRSILKYYVTYYGETVIYELLSDWFTPNGNTFRAPDINITFASKSCLSIVNFDLSSIYVAIKTRILITSSASYDIPSTFYKMAWPDIQILLLKIFTLSFEVGTHPESWKVTYVVPKHKSEAKNRSESYKPIDITPFTSHTLDKLIQDQLSDHLIHEDPIDSSRRGFIRTMSCSICLTEDFIEVICIRNLKKLANILYFDGEKAFYKVPHNFLINRVQSVGITNSPFEWIRCVFFPIRSIRFFVFLSRGSNHI